MSLATTSAIIADETRRARDKRPPPPPPDPQAAIEAFALVLAAAQDATAARAEAATFCAELTRISDSWKAECKKIAELQIRSDMLDLLTTRHWAVEDQLRDLRARVERREVTVEDLDPGTYWSAYYVPHPSARERRETLYRGLRSDLARSREEVIAAQTADAHKKGFR